MKVAALFVQTNGIYYGLRDVDPWDEERDARLYPGPWPVVAHPPCSRWCQMARLNQKRYGHRVGDDGGCFESALESARSWGGVIEHPAHSIAWKTFGLQKPQRGRWSRSILAPHEWVTEVSQSTYGHPARKRTWLLYCSTTEPPPLDWSETPPTAQVSYVKTIYTGQKRVTGEAYALPPLTSKAASATPLPFRDLLLSLARSSTVHPVRGCR